MKRLTYRYVTKVVDFGGELWQRIESDLKAKGIYWFLTDPYKGETVAIMVYKYHEERFLEIVNDQWDAEFYGREL